MEEKENEAILKLRSYLNELVKIKKTDEEKTPVYIIYEIVDKRENDTPVYVGYCFWEDFTERCIEHFTTTDYRYIDFKMEMEGRENFGIEIIKKIYE